MVSIRPQTAYVALCVTQCCFIAAIGLVAVRAFLRPAIHMDTAAASVPAGMTDAHETDSEKRNLDWYAPLWQRDLRQALRDEQFEQRPTPDPPPLLPRLLGTFVESNTQWAHLASPSGKLRVCGMDSLFDGFRVEHIETGRVRLAHGSHEYWIEVPQPEAVVQAR